MQTPSLIRVTLLGLAFAAASCSHYSTVSEKRPVYQSATPAGQMIAGAIKMSSKQPEAKIGRYLDAAAAAGTVLAKNPGDSQARADYNFAVARMWDPLESTCRHASLSIL